MLTASTGVCAAVLLAEEGREPEHASILNITCARVGHCNTCSLGGAPRVIEVKMILLAGGKLTRNNLGLR